ncbi:MAG: chorismate mutase [Rhodospirillaceae bacterium]|nr:chorismate mutase [Rhodospirillaceae bacterium]
MGGDTTQRTERAASASEDDWRVECQTLDDVRRHIDRFDAEIAALISKRHHFVMQAAKFKPTVEAVVVPERIEEIIARVRAVAAKLGVNPDLLEKTYRAMLAGTISDEQRRWRELHGGKS